MQTKKGRNIIFNACGLRKATRGLWLGIALALSAGAAQAQALSGSDAALLLERMNTLEVKVDSNHETLEAKMDSDNKLLRAERRAEHAEMRAEHGDLRRAIVESENRIILFICGTVLGVFALFPFYLALLRRFLPGLFAPPNHLFQTTASGNAERPSRAYPAAPPEGGFAEVGVKEPKP